MAGGNLDDGGEGRVETLAEFDGKFWILNVEKYFASNVGAQLAVVAARFKGEGKGVRSLGLFLLPRYKIGTRSVPTGEVELKNSQAYLLGDKNNGIYIILEVLNISRVANAVGSVALAQRAIYEAYIFAKDNEGFCPGLGERDNAKWGFLGETALFKLSPCLQTFGTSCKILDRASKWSMEVNAGMGVLVEYGVERLLSEAMILPIWEGTPHRQVLDAVEVIVKSGRR